MPGWGFEDMMYKTDHTLLPDKVLEAMLELHQALVEETDYLHVQLTMDDLREGFNPSMHVVVAKPND